MTPSVTRLGTSLERTSWLSPYPPRVEMVFGGGLWPLGQTVGFVELDEELEAYSLTRVRDRFTRPILLRYLSALGIDADTMST